MSKARGQRVALHRPLGLGLVGHGDLRASLALIFPLWLGYSVATAFGAPLNGVDVTSHLMFAASRQRKTIYLVEIAVLAVLFLWWAKRSGNDRHFRFEVFATVGLESAIWGLGLGLALSLFIERGLGLSLGGFELASAVGAGVYEELVFRCFAMAAATMLALRLGLSRLTAVLLAAVASSLLFALAHHIGASASPIHIDVFLYRSIAGLAFAAIYWQRSLAHAVYAHAIYDIAVFA